MTQTTAAPEWQLEVTAMTTPAGISLWRLVRRDERGSERVCYYPMVRATMNRSLGAFSPADQPLQRRTTVAYRGRSSRYREHFSLLGGKGVRPLQGDGRRRPRGRAGCSWSTAPPVERHLRKVFAKLAIKSRRQFRDSSPRSEFPAALE